MQNAPRLLRPAAQFGRYQQPLLAYVNDMLDLADHRRGPEISRAAWAMALGSLHVGTDAGMEADIPTWLAQAARQVVRERTSPSYHAAQLTTVVTLPETTPAVVEPLAA
ncbi:hypothetical protein ACWCWD_29215 [Streptomyces sp. NPDC001493]